MAKATSARKDVEEGNSIVGGDGHFNKQYGK